MKIAIPTRGTIIDDHFGHCESYTVITTDDSNKIIETAVIPSVSGCGCKSGIAGDLKKMGVEVMIAGNMGDGAFNVLSNNGIKVYRGYRGEVSSVVSGFLQGDKSDSGVSCSHHHDHGSEGSGHVCHN